MNSEHKKILLYYGLLHGTFYAMFLPFLNVSFLASVGLIFLIFFLYAARSKADEDSLLENHLSYLIKSFWKGNIFLVLFFAIGGVFLSLTMDYAPIMPCLDYVMNNAMSLAQKNDLSTVIEIFKPCEKQFLAKNMGQLIATGTIAFIPSLAYLSYRLVYGLIVLRKNRLISLRRF